MYDKMMERLFGSLSGLAFFIVFWGGWYARERGWWWMSLIVLVIMYRVFVKILKSEK